MSDDVLIAVDLHRASNTAAMLESVSKTVLASARFANTADGYGQLPMGGGGMLWGGPVAGPAAGR